MITATAISALKEDFETKGFVGPLPVFNKQACRRFVRLLEDTRPPLDWARLDQGKRGLITRLLRDGDPPRCAGRAVLDALCWTRCAGRAVLDALCWTRCAGRAVLDALCWTRCAGRAVLDALCWTRCAGRAVLDALCWTRCAGRAVLDALCWTRCAGRAVLDPVEALLGPDVML